jgi:uncharacterized protein YcbK (DUF882 family)
MNPNIYSNLRYFDEREFEYPYKMDVQLLRRLDTARALAGIPFVITSDYRSEAHNEAVGGSPDSAHMKGLAVDLSCPDSHTRFIMIDGLRTAGFRRIGLGANFIHVDIDDSKPDQRIWLY